jgi:hypothetical protein
MIEDEAELGRMTNSFYRELYRSELYILYFLDKSDFIIYIEHIKCKMPPKKLHGSVLVLVQKIKIVRVSPRELVT